MKHEEISNFHVYRDNAKLSLEFDKVRDYGWVYKPVETG